ncbi:endoribonuclease YbeY-like isoform X4 [Octodon degus]|uniref:Endoribonuclease YbeY-like isoform X4 n=1 Tax=Octodon degus TaxID=10160 RepID=A0A6P6EEI4_OCTDE|nr:endoribonuclease YbeY-like isoform X4 [Octodon degus]
MSLVIRNLQSVIPIRKVPLRRNVEIIRTTHGLCHLLRFTHNSETEWQNMYLQEKQVLEELSRCTGAQLLPLSRGLF